MIVDLTFGSVVIWTNEGVVNSTTKSRDSLLLFLQLLNQKAIESSDKERPTPDLRTGDIVEIKLVIYCYLLCSEDFWVEKKFIVVFLYPDFRRFLKTDVGCLFIKVLLYQNKMQAFTQQFESEEL